MKNKLGVLLVSLMCFVGCGNTNNSSSIATNSSSTQSSSKVSFSSTTSSKEEDRVAVYDLEHKTSFANHVQYKGEQSNKEEEYKDRDRNYKVGDENPFDFKPQLTLAILPAGSTNIEDIEFDYNADWSYNVTLSLLNDNEEYVDANLYEYTDSLDKDNCLIDFSDSAIGHTFKISLYPEGLNEEQMKKLTTDWTKEYVVDVIEGYNVTNAKELAYVQNSTKKMDDIGSIKGESYKTVWDEFKTNNNLKLDYAPEAMILHNDITITKDDIPSAYFYNENEISVSKDNPNYNKILGSYKDWNVVYFRDFAKNSKFTFEGNYFTLNASAIPTVVKDNDSNEVPEYFISHGVLFRFEGEESGESAIQNTKLIGNAPRKDDSTLSGGIIMVKVEGPAFTGYNNIANRWFITYFPNEGNAPFVMEKCRAYNNFNSFIYNYGCSDVVIEDCEFKRAGGPVIIQDHVNADDTDPENDMISNTRIVNSTLESIVAGSEGWFKIMSADQMADQIKAMDIFFNMNGRTFLSKKNEIKYLNFISLNKSSEAEGITTNLNTRGYVSVEKDDFKYTFGYGAEGSTNPYFGQFYGAVTGMDARAPVFESSNYGMAYTDASTGLYGVDMSTGKPAAVASTDNIFKGDYLSLYNGGMQILMDYYQLEA